MARYDDLDTKNLVVVGICGAVGTLLSVVALQVLYYKYESSEYTRKVLSVSKIASDSVLAEQRGKLSSYAWVDREQNIVTIPIDQAMSDVVAREKRATSKDSTNAN